METNTRKTIATYNATAEAYAQATKDLDMAHEREIFLRRMPATGEILDIGCGWGKDAKIFTNLGYQVSGVDLSEGLLDIARKTSPQSFFYNWDFSDMGFDNESFEGLWASASLLHAETKAHVPGILREWNRVFKTGGSAYIVVKQGEGEEDLVDKRYDGAIKHYCYFQEDEIKGLVEKAGFKDVVTELPGKEGEYYTHPWINIYATK